MVLRVKIFNNDLDEKLKLVYFAIFYYYFTAAIPAEKRDDFQNGFNDKPSPFCYVLRKKLI